MEAHLACIVEGHGEVSALPILIRRLAALVDPGLMVHIPPPIRTPRGRLLKAGELERAVELAVRKLGARGGVLLLIDAHGDCPATMGPELLRRATEARGDVPLAAVVAKQEYEAWFLAAAESIRGRRGLALDLTAPADPEAVQGAKEWLTAHMEGSRKYVETLDQPALTTHFDLNAARQGSDSFDKCSRCILQLLQQLRRG